MWTIKKRYVYLGLMVISMGLGLFIERGIEGNLLPDLLLFAGGAFIIYLGMK